MAWVRIDENFAQHPKVLLAGPLGMAMHVAALCYCNRHLTDGFVPKQIARLLLDLDGIAMRCWENDTCGSGECATWNLVIDDLVASGLWHQVDGGWRIHDYLEYQPSKARSLEIKETRRESGAKGGLAKAKQFAKQNSSNLLSKPPSKTEAKTCPVPVPLEEDKKDNSSLRSESSASADLAVPNGTADHNIPDDMVAVWNAELGDLLAKPRKLDKTRRAKLANRFKDDFGSDIQRWRDYCRTVRSSPHLVGENDRGWRADLDWCLEPRNLNRILEGRYAKRAGPGPPHAKRQLLDKIQDLENYGQHADKGKLQ